MGNVEARFTGRVLTAWSKAAGILGPVLVNYIRASSRSATASRPANAYTFTMYVLVAFLGVGLICNLAVRQVDKSLLTLAPLASSRDTSRKTLAAAPAGERGLVAAGWQLAGVPIGWGVFRTRSRS